MEAEYNSAKPEKNFTARLDVDFALKAAKLGVWEFDPTTNQIRWDARCRELFGLAHDNLISYEQAIQHIHPADLSRVDEAVKWTLNSDLSDGSYDLTYRTIGADDGLLRWVRFIGQAILDEQGHVMHFGGVAQDVTKDELARQLTESEERYRTMVEKAPVAIGVLRGENLVIESANSRMLDLLHKPASIIGKPWLEALPELAGTPAIDIINTVYQTGVPFTTSEFPAQLEKDGVLQQGYYSFSYLPLTENGVTSGVLQVAIEITDQVVARQKVAESETRFRALIEEAPVATCLFVGRELRIDMANEAMIAIWGKGPSVLGKPLADVLPELREQHFLQTLDDVFTTGIAHETKAGRADLFIDGTLTTYYFDYTFKPLRNTEGEVYAIVEMATDVTAEVRMKQKLQEGEAYLRNLTDTVPAIIWETKPDGYCNYLNKQWYELTGQTPTEAEGFGWLDATHPDDKAEASRLFLEANAKQSPFYALYRLRQADGTYRWSIDKASPRFSATGTYEGLIGTVIDIHKQVTAQKELAEQKIYLQNAIDIANLGTFSVDLTTGLSTYNEAIRDWLGLDSLTQPIDVIFNRIHPNDRALVERILMNEQENQHDVVYRIDQPHIEGVRYLRSIGKRLIINGITTTITGIIQDVTPQLLVQQRIQDSQQRLLSSFEAAPVGIAVIGRENLTFQMVNPFYAGLTGRTPDQLIGKPLLEVMPEIEGKGFDKLMENVFATGLPYIASEVSTQVYRNDQLEAIYVDFSYHPQYESDSNVVSSILVVAIDVAEQVLARRKIEESEQQYRLLSAHLDEQVQRRTQQLQDSIQDLERSNQNLQQFAYVASHDLQEPLRKIRAFGDILQSQYAGELGEGVDHLQRMQSAASRMSVLIRDLLSYSRISTRQEIAGSVSVGEVVNVVLTDLELVIAETGAIVQVAPLPTVQGDRSQLGQLFQNLLSNALKFRRPDTTPMVTITAAHVPAADLPPTVRPTRQAASYYRLDVVDNGIGFDEKYLDRIFQVFQRLHGRSNFAGTGIGLAICEKVAANHGGAITATSQPDQGSTFSVYLPVV